MKTVQPESFRQGDACLILVGLTAGWRKRRSVRKYFRTALDMPVLVPWLPYPLGLAACALWLRRYLRRHLGPSGNRRVHILAYIGGGFLLRSIVADGLKVPIGWIVYDRGPIQERVAARLVQRNSKWALILLGGRTFLDLASGRYRSLPFPSAELGQGLIVEANASKLAICLGVDAPFGPEVVAGLLPGATDVVSVAVSHDDVYTSPLFLEPALRFLTTGCFDPMPQEGRIP